MSLRCKSITIALLLIAVTAAFAVSNGLLSFYVAILSGDQVNCSSYRVLCNHLRYELWDHPALGAGPFPKRDYVYHQGGKETVKITASGDTLKSIQIMIENLPTAQQQNISAARAKIGQLLGLNQTAPGFQDQVNQITSRIYGILRALMAPSGATITVGLEGAGVGGSRIYTNSGQALQSEAKNLEKSANEALRIAITGGKVDIQPTSQSIAVLPPGIFGQPASETGYGAISPETFLEKIRTFLFDLSVPAFILLVILGGLLMILAPFSKGYIDLGKKYIYWAVIGYIVLLVASAAIALLRGLFGSR